MKTFVKNNRQVSYRFRRWSRKGYAVFNSLSKSVSIGSLAISITSKTFIKKSVELLSNSSNTNSLFEKEEDDEDELSLSLRTLIEAITVKEQISVAAATLLSYKLINYLPERLNQCQIGSTAF